MREPPLLHPPLPIPALTEEGVLESLNGLENLPTLPQLARRLLDTVDSPNAGVREVTDVLKADQAISMQVLRVANSAYYGLVTRVASLERAIMVLGFDEIRRIALSALLIRALPPIPGAPGFKVEAFWIHALAAAHAARFVAESLGRRDLDESYTAGLLHDVGKIVAAERFPRHFGFVIHYANQLRRTPFAVEPAILGADHPMIGRWLATIWNLPPSLVEAIGCHHARDSGPSPASPGDRLVHVVGLANALAHRVGLGDGIGAAPPHRPHAEALGLREDDLRGVAARLDAARTAIRSHLG